MLVQEGDRDRGDVGVAAVQGRLAHAGGGGDLLHGDGAAVLLAEQPGGRGEHAGAVAGGVGALAGRWLVGAGQLHPEDPTG